MVIRFFVPHPFVAGIGDQLERWTVIVAAATVVLGVANLLRIHLKKVSAREKDWQFSLPLIAGVLIMLLFGLAPASTWTALGFRAGGVSEGSPFDFMYQRAYVPMQGTMFSLLAFYVASAAYRAFRIRKMEAGLLAVAGVLVMIGRVPIGRAIADFLPDIATVIMDYPSTAAQRAIKIGAALGAISTGLKIILGIERNAIGSD
ncbi:MAG: hypothetical protein IT349_06970 [Candidatus Eisenbacteria bacterium]|nr:hypothetical protein [Candidatus Eisenbacteria bacterium]MCC7141830.1 hypothetical protein [Candidatus Eisenbacteria bacterium]